MLVYDLEKLVRKTYVILSDLLLMDLPELRFEYDLLVLSIAYLLVADVLMEMMVVEIYMKVLDFSVIENNSFAVLKLIVLMTFSSLMGIFGTEVNSMSHVVTFEVKQFGGHTFVLEGLYHVCFVDFLMKILEPLDDEHV